MEQNPTYIIASTEIDIGSPISRYSWYRDSHRDAKQILISQLANMAMQFASNHSLDVVNNFVDNFYFELPPEPPTDYTREASEDAALLITDYFMDEMAEQLIDYDKISTDMFGDYDNGDGIFHEVVTDRSYSLSEAAEVLSQLYRHVEEDTGLWERETDVDRIAEIQAAYTYGNAVYSEFIDIVEDINDNVIVIKLDAARAVLDDNGIDWTEMDADEMFKTIEPIEDYRDAFKEMLKKEIISLMR